MRQPSLFDGLDGDGLGGDAKGARDAAFAQIKGRAGPWWSLAWTAALDVAAEHAGQRVTGEDMRRLMLRQGLPKPHHHNTWGVFMRGLIGQILIPTGDLVAMRTKKSHARKTPEYQLRRPT